MKRNKSDFLQTNSIVLYKDVRPFITKRIKDRPIVIVRDLKQQYNERLVYENINFQIDEGERLAFLGPNGSGKTTMISTICGFIKPTSGKIEYLFDYDKVPFERLSVQFQDLKFPASLSPRDLIDFTVKLIGNDMTKDEIEKGIDTFGIRSILNTRLSKLSGGQQQRVNVFISMIGKPKMLFLDEFTTGLDIPFKTRLQEYILDFCKKNKITLVTISHDIDSIEEMSDRIIILANRKIMVDASTEEIISKFGSIKKCLKKYILS